MFKLCGHNCTCDCVGNFLSQQQPNMPECTHVNVAGTQSHNTPVTWSLKVSWLSMVTPRICSLAINGTDDCDTMMPIHVSSLDTCCRVSVTNALILLG